MNSNYNELNLENLSETLLKIIVEANNKCTKKKIYVAAPWFTDKSKLMLQTFKLIVQYINKKYIFYYPDEHNEKTPNDTYLSNILAINDCDILIALIAEKDVGTAFEIGYAKALGKLIILVGYDETCFNSKTNIMLAFASELPISFEDLIKVLETEDLTSIEGIKIDNTWSTKQ